MSEHVPIVAERPILVVDDDTANLELSEGRLWVEGLTSVMVETAPDWHRGEAGIADPDTRAGCGPGRHARRAARRSGGWCLARQLAVGVASTSSARKFVELEGLGQLALDLGQRSRRF